MPVDLGRVAIRDYINDCVDAIRAIGRRKVIIVSHSMGTLIGAKVAEENPDLVAGYIGMASAPPRWVVMGPRTVLKMPKYFGKMLGKHTFTLNARDARDLLLNGLCEKYIREALSQMCPESGTAAMEVTLGKYAMHELSCPSLLIGGKFDRITPFQRPVAKKLGAKYIELALPHMMMANVPLVSATIDGWLKRLPIGLSGY